MRGILWDFWIDYRSRIVLLAAVFVVFVILLTASPGVDRWRSLVGEPQDASQAARLLAGLATLAGGFFALWRWTVDQRWKRVQYAQQLLDKFFDKANTKIALRMLDVQGKTKIPLCGTTSRTKTINLDGAMIKKSLRTLEQQQRFGEPYFSIRMTFDEFFTDLAMFQHHIDAGLIKLKDVRPHLRYWIKSINGYGLIYEPSVAEQINLFLRYFDHESVLRFSKLMGHEFNPVTTAQKGLNTPRPGTESVDG